MSYSGGESPDLPNLFSSVLSPSVMFQILAVNTPKKSMHLSAEILFLMLNSRTL